MTAEIIDGKAAAAELRADVAKEVADLPRTPGLATLLVGDDPASAIAGRLILGEQGLRPCTPSGVMYLLDRAGVELEGREAVVVGRSSLVGKPQAQMLLERNATVTTCHSRTGTSRP